MASRPGFFRRRKLRRNLLGHDPQAREESSEELLGAGWQPRNDTEKAALLVAQRKWEEAEALGATAVRFIGETMEKVGPYTSKELAELLGQMKCPEAVPHMLATIERGDGWVTISGEVMAYEETRGVIDRAAGLFPGMGMIGGMIDAGSVRVEIREACENALVAIAKEHPTVVKQIRAAQKSKRPWARESAQKALVRLGKSP